MCVGIGREKPSRADFPSCFPSPKFLQYIFTTHPPLVFGARIGVRPRPRPNTHLIVQGRNYHGGFYPGPPAVSHVLQEELSRMRPETPQWQCSMPQKILFGVWIFSCGLGEFEGVWRITERKRTEHHRTAACQVPCCILASKSKRPRQPQLRFRSTRRRDDPVSAQESKRACGQN